MIDRPVCEDSFAVDVVTSYGAKHARIVGAIAVVAHHEVIPFRNLHRTVARSVEIIRRNVRLGDFFAIDVHMAEPNFESLTGQRDNALDETFRSVERIPENDDIAAINWLEAIDNFVDEDVFLIAE